MWFKFPEGTTQISIEQQIFGPEVEDGDGNAYFRTPDHFAPIILGLNGFVRVAEDQLPKGAPPDLPKTDPQRDAALDILSADHTALQEQYKILLETHTALMQERDGLVAQLDGAKKEIERLEDVLEKIEEENKKAKK